MKVTRNWPDIKWDRHDGVKDDDTVTHYWPDIKWDRHDGVKDDDTVTHYWPDIKWDRHDGVKDDDVGEESHGCDLDGSSRAGGGDEALPVEVTLEVVAHHVLPHKRAHGTDETAAQQEDEDLKTNATHLLSSDSCTAGRWRSENKRNIFIVIRQLHSRKMKIWKQTQHIYCHQTAAKQEDEDLKTNAIYLLSSDSCTAGRWRSENKRNTVIVIRQLHSRKMKIWKQT